MNADQIGMLTEAALKIGIAIIATGYAIRAWVVKPLRNRRNAEKKAAYIKVRADKSIHGEF